jgi:hypothetical protein
VVQVTVLAQVARVTQHPVLAVRNPEPVVRVTVLARLAKVTQHPVLAVRNPEPVVRVPVVRVTVLARVPRVSVAAEGLPAPETAEHPPCSGVHHHGCLLGSSYRRHSHDISPLDRPQGNRCVTSRT